MGVDVVRIYASWYAFSPRPDARQMPDGFDPSNPRDYPQGPYDGLDETIEGIQNHGMAVVLTPTGPFPKWASRSHRSNLKYPKPALFRDWIYSLARRYSGNFEVYGRNLPNVGRWAIWNEPNLARLPRAAVQGRQAVLAQALPAAVPRRPGGAARFRERRRPGPDR